MPSSDRNPKIVAFLGATGGCTLATLTHTLLANTNNHHCVALARTPSKLRNLLLAQERITPALLSERLTIIQGDARDKEAVKQVLTAKPATGKLGGESDVVADTILSGLGGQPKLQWSLWEPVTLDNPTICQDSANTLVAALQELGAEGRLGWRKPLVAFVSTTGISTGKEDVPFGLRWLYHYVLKVPHVDKREMETTFRQAAADSEKGKRVLRGVVGVRPSLLMGTGDIREEVGMGKVRVGSEQEPAVGYRIRRADVGSWVFREVVERGGEKWEGQMVTLTY
jgi:NAD(P)H-binding